MNAAIEMLTVAAVNLRIVSSDVDAVVSLPDAATLKRHDRNISKVGEASGV